MGDPVSIVVVIGHPTAGSRTGAVARHTAERLAPALSSAGVPVRASQVVDLAELAPRLFEAGGPEPALRAVCGADLLLTASPTFRAAYSGLLKLFLDLLPRGGLAGTVAVPVTTAGLVAHWSTVDVMLSTLLRELRAEVPVPGVRVLEEEFARMDDVFEKWWAEHGTALCQVMLRRGAGLAQEVASC
jgi:FMN reductase